MSVKVLMNEREGLVREVESVYNLVHEFHEKYDIAIGVRSQTEMYQRCTLLLEEISEVQSAIEEHSNIGEELADVYYVLVGNLVSMGYKPKEQLFSFYETLNDESPSSALISTLGQVSKMVRKHWNPEDGEFIRKFTNIHLDAIKAIHYLALQNNILDVKREVEKKHKVLLTRKSKKIGDSVVVSHWRN